MINFRRVDDLISTGGQPTEDELRALSEEGVEVVVSLLPDDAERALPNEGAMVRRLGMKFVHVPVDWKEPTPADFTAFSTILDRVVGKKMLIHCAANYRVTAFFGLHAVKRLGWSFDRFDAFVRDVWDPKDYPAWDRFISEMKDVIAASG